MERQKIRLGIRKHLLCDEEVRGAAARIMAVRDGERKPLFDAALEGRFSPSPSLRIEKHTIGPTNWQRITIPQQVLILSLETHELQYDTPAAGLSHVMREQGEVLLEKRDCEQKIRWKSSAAMLSVELADSVLDDVEMHAPVPGSAVVSSCAAQVNPLSPLMYALEAEREHGYPHGQLFLDGIEQAIATMVVTMTGRSRSGKQTHKPRLAPYQMRHVDDYVQNHLGSRITLASMAREAGLSPAHFSRLFRNASGTTPHYYVLNRRIEHAKSLLSASHHSLLDVALATGFHTHQHFSRVFRRITGVSPSVYRARM